MSESLERYFDDYGLDGLYKRDQRRKECPLPRCRECETKINYNDNLDNFINVDFDY